MTDDELVERFEACALEEFHHADHVRVAWTLLRRLPLPDALERFALALRRFAAAAGVAQKYDDALTRRYVGLIAARMTGGEASWSAFASANPDLLTWPPPTTYEILR